MHRMRKRTALLFTLMTLSVLQSVWAKPCALPMQQIEVAGIRLAQPISEFQKQHPTASVEVLGDDHERFEFKNGVDELVKKAGVTSFGHIAFDDKKQIISSFSASFLDGPLATYETDLERFKQNILKHSNVPKVGWKAKDNAYLYSCQDYVINIIQDHGAVKSAVGPIVMVFSKYSDIWESVQK